jgi:hypothetical protein
MVDSGSSADKHTRETRGGTARPVCGTLTGKETSQDLRRLVCMSGTKKIA